MVEFKVVKCFHVRHLSAFKASFKQKKKWTVVQFDLCISPLGQKPREEHLKWIFYFRKIYLWKNGRYLTLSLSTIKVFVSFVSKLRMYIPAQAYLCKIIRVFSPTDLEQTSFWIAAIFSVSVAKFSKLVNFKKSKNNDKATRYMAGLNTYSWGLSRLFRKRVRESIENES